MADEHEYQGAESVEERETVVQPPAMESYAEGDDGELPFIPQIAQAKYVDLKNPQNMAKKPDVNANPNAAYQNAMAQQNLGSTEPTFENASTNMNKLDGMLDVMNNIAYGTPNAPAGAGNASNRPQDNQGIQQAIKNIHAAVKTLEGVEYWIPSQYADEFPEKLKKISSGIVKALNLYVSKVEELI